MHRQLCLVVSALVALTQSGALVDASAGDANDFKKWVVQPPLAAAANQLRVIDHFASIVMLSNNRTAACQDDGLPKNMLETLNQPDSNLLSEFRALGGIELMRFQYKMASDPRYGFNLGTSMPGVGTDYKAVLDLPNRTHGLSWDGDDMSAFDLNLAWRMEAPEVGEHRPETDYELAHRLIQALSDREQIDIGIFPQSDLPPSSLDALTMSAALEWRSFLSSTNHINPFEDLGGFSVADALQDRIFDGNPEIELRGGDPGKDPDPLGLQAKVDCMFVSDGVAEITGNSDTPQNCGVYGDRSKNHCFLPVVSVLENTRTGTLNNNCAGTIIGANHIVTAAHCVCETPRLVVVGTGIRPLAMLYEEVLVASALADAAAAPILGLKHDYVAKDGLVSTAVTVGEVIRYNEDMKAFLCQPARTKSGDDLALIRVNIPRPFPEWARAVLIAPPSPGTVVNIVGFSIDPAVDDGRAGIKRYGSSRLEKSDENFHTVFDADALKRETCQGDSGSGAHVRLADGQLGIFGVLSQGETNCQTVGNSYYVRVSEGKRLEWLRDHVPDLTIIEEPVFADDHSKCIGLGCP